MELLLESNYQLIKKLVRIDRSYKIPEELDPDIDGNPMKIDILSQEEIIKTLSDQITNTVEILKFLSKTDCGGDEVMAAKEECINRVIKTFSSSKVQAINHFVQVYINLLNNRYNRVETDDSFSR